VSPAEPVGQSLYPLRCLFFSRSEYANLEGDPARGRYVVVLCSLLPPRSSVFSSSFQPSSSFRSWEVVPNWTTSPGLVPRFRPMFLVPDIEVLRTENPLCDSRWSCLRFFFFFFSYLVPLRSFFLPNVEFKVAFLGVANEGLEPNVSSLSLPPRGHY